MTEGTSAAVEAVKAFFEGMEEENFDKVASMLADDVVYVNVGYTKMRGRDPVVKVFRLAARFTTFKVKYRAFTDGNVVMTERLDAVLIGPVRIQFWVCGVFEVRDGKITLWKDYFDAFDFFVKAPLHGLLGAVIPPLRPKFPGVLGAA
jgi:limonene-1,2-epoxide hydrolase